MLGRQAALASRSTKQHERGSAVVKEMPQLQVGDCVFIQNQSVNCPKKLDNRGQVVEVKEFYQYRVMLEGSRRMTLQKRKYLRKSFHAKPVRNKLIELYGTHLFTEDPKMFQDYQNHYKSYPEKNEMLRWGLLKKLKMVP